MPTTSDAAKLDSVLAHLEGTLQLQDVAQRHGVSISEVESWKALYLQGARASTRTPKRVWPKVLVGVVALGALTAFAQVSICATGWPTQLICFAPDSPAVADSVNANFKKVWEGTVPVGTIVAWHKSLAASSLPASWVECNGQTVSDTASPYNGLAVPNLNGGGRFLRGGATSGVLQDDAFQGHKHDLNPGLRVDLLSYVHPSGSFELFGSDQRACTGASGCSTGYYDQYNIVAPNIDNVTTLGANGAPRFGTETRPSNMSVVWVMRIR